jgi:hypothetical protein
VINCPYCGKGTLPLTSENAVWIDIGVRGAWIARAFLELKASPVFSWPNLARSLLAREAVTIAPEDGRPCPYCRRGIVTRHAAPSIWLDLGARAAGLARVYLELRENRPGLTWHELATVLVEGEGADLSYLDEPIEAGAVAPMTSDDDDDDDEGIANGGPRDIARLDSARG